jgi:hypothetical protein
MIFNAYTIVTLFIDVLTGILSIFLIVNTFKIYQKSKNSLQREERTDIENKSYLILLIAVVVLFVKLLSLPIFYVTLWSYIPHINGAMCIYGVTQVKPLLSSIVQIFKFVVFFFIGGWLILNRFDRTVETTPLFKRKFLLLFIVSILIFMDSIGGILYFTGFNIKGFVACCTTYFDLPERATAVIPASIIGKEYGKYMLAIYYMSNILLIAFLGVTFSRITSHSIVTMIIAAEISLLNAVIAVFAILEVIAPEVMNMPLHHCIYCMWQYSPDSILMSAFLVIGTFAPGWALMLVLTGRHKDTADAMTRYLKKLYIIGIIGLSASLAIVTAHFLFKG